MPLVLLESEGPVRTIRLNAPDRRNSLDWPLLDELSAAIATVEADADARALVVAGNGTAFCAGADLQNLFGDLERPVDQLRAHLMRAYASFLGLRDLTIPTIAAVHGAAVGAGLNIALACDLLVAGPRARFGPTFTEIGLHPGGGCSWLLTRRIGPSRALKALLDGALIGAEEAARLGLADVLVADPLDHAQDLAATYAVRDPALTADVKRSVQLASTSDLATSLAFEAHAQAVSLGSQEFRAFAARFTDR